METWTWCWAGDVRKSQGHDHQPIGSPEIQHTILNTSTIWMSAKKKHQRWSVLQQMQRPMPSWSGPAAGHNSPACLAVSEDLRAAQRANSPRKCHSEALVNSYELVRTRAPGMGIWWLMGDESTWWWGQLSCADCNLQEMQVESIPYGSSRTFSGSGTGV